MDSYWFVLGWQAPSPVPVVLSLCLIRTSRQACRAAVLPGLPPTPTTPQPSLARAAAWTALHPGAKHPKSHQLLICHPRTARCPWQGGQRPCLGREGEREGRSRRLCGTLAQLGCPQICPARGTALLPADPPAPPARTAPGNGARLREARAAWQQQQQRRSLEDKLHSSISPRTQGNVLPALPPSPPHARALVEQP